MKQKVLSGFFMAALFMLIYSCSSVKVISNYDEGTDFSKYKTIEYLGWSKGSEGLISQEDKGRIEDAFREEFISRSFEPADGEPDLLVSLFLVLNVETITADYIAHHNGYYGIGALGPSANMPVEDYDIVEGTLIIDIFDAESELLVWQGIGTKTVDDNPNSREKNIPKSVAKIMEEFPVQARDN